MSFTSPLLSRLKALRVSHASAAPAAPQHTPAPQPKAPQPKAQTPQHPAAPAPHRGEGERRNLPQSPTPSKRPQLPAKSPDHFASADKKALELAGLPEHLGQMVGAAAAGEVASGARLLTSGLVMDLGGYVLAWAEVWPRDREHVLRRLNEAYEVWGHK